MKSFYDSFDEGTITKLEIFEKYIKNWIPVFINRNKIEAEVNIFDLFAGPGYDKNKKPGSPILILKSIQYHKNNFINSKVNLILNDAKKEIYKELEKNCREYFEKYPDIKRLVNVKYYNEDFEIIFEKVKNSIGKNPTLLLLDQFGVKHINIIKELDQFPKTDFILFLSSSFIRRFAETDEFRNILRLSEDDIEKIKNTPYKLIHETVVDIIKEKFSDDSKLKLYPYSFKKGANVYGIIYGTRHILGAEKFLRIAWRINPDNGRADYDIYDDERRKGRMLFPEFVGKTTVEAFKAELQRNVLAGKITNNIDAYIYAIEKGFIPKHAKEVLKDMKKTGKIDYDKNSPGITYSNYQKGIKIIFVLRNNIQKICKKSLLYKTKVEYGNWTINHIVGCKHGCKFPCYAMMMAKKFGWVKDYEDWRKPRIVENALELLEKEVPKNKNKINFVHLCFMSDPFMYDYEKQDLVPEIKSMTLKIIEKLNKEGIKVTTLTKGIQTNSLQKMNME